MHKITKKEIYTNKLEYLYSLIKKRRNHGLYGYCFSSEEKEILTIEIEKLIKIINNIYCEYEPDNYGSMQYRKDLNCIYNKVCIIEGQIRRREYIEGDILPQCKYFKIDPHEEESLSYFNLKTKEDRFRKAQIESRYLYKNREFVL